jgi:hypothetical protein
MGGDIDSTLSEKKESIEEAGMMYRVLSPSLRPAMTATAGMSPSVYPPSLLCLHASAVQSIDCIQPLMIDQGCMMHIQLATKATVKKLRVQ